MARIRSVKPEFWKSEAIARLSHRERLTFIALWSYVDDNGVGRDVPQLIAGELFALEPDPREALANVRGDLARLADEGRITRYTVDGKAYLHITNWHEHQRIDKPNKPRYPGPDDPSAAPTCGYGDPRDTLATPSRGSSESPPPEQWSSGTEEQGAEENPSSSLALRGERRPDPFDSFWAQYPRKVGKVAARKAYLKARRSVDHDTIMAGVIRYADDPTREPAFTAHPSTWLNEGRWEDEGPVRPAGQLALGSTRPSTADQRAMQGLALVEHFRRQEGA